MFTLSTRKEKQSRQITKCNSSRALKYKLDVSAKKKKKVKKRNKEIINEVFKRYLVNTIEISANASGSAPASVIIEEAD